MQTRFNSVLFRRGNVTLKVIVKLHGIVCFNSVLFRRGNVTIGGINPNALSLGFQFSPL